MTTTLMPEPTMTARPRHRRVRWAVGAGAAAVVLAAGLAWASKPSLAEACGTPVTAGYAAAAADHRDVVLAVEGGRPRWVCETTYADGATSRSWTSRP